jgi:lipopolysaccharide transport system ATP-binding protein
VATQTTATCLQDDKIRAQLGEQASDNIAIRVSNLSKCNQIYDTPRDRLKQFVVPTLILRLPATA